MDKKERQKELNRIACKKYRESVKGKARIKDYQKEYCKNNKELRAAIHKKWREENKERFLAYTKQWRLDNPDKVKINEQNRDHNKKKISTKQWALDNPDKVKINGWKSWGIIWDDYNIIYDLYITTTNCDYCNKEFKDSQDRCLDHDHSINDSNNIRGFLCRVCNTKDVLKGYDIMELCTN